MKKKNKVEERAKKYNCNGICYSRYHMCPNADTCPETGWKEFIATIGAIICIILMILAIPISIIVFIILSLIN